MPPPQWVAKNDAEGFGMNVLHGITMALEEYALKGLSIEINDYTLGFCGTSADEIFAFLRDKGYRPLSKTDIENRWPLEKAPNVFLLHPDPA